MATYELPPFLGAPVPVELLAELTGWERDARGLTLRVRTDRYEPLLQDYYGTVCETVFTEPAAGRPVTVRIDAQTAEILRIRTAPGDAVPDHATPMVVGRFDDPVDLDVVEDERTVELHTAALRVVVVREPFRIEVRDRDGRLLLGTRPVDLAPLRRGEDRWNPAEQRWLFAHRYAYPPGSAPGASPRAFLSLDLRHDERIHGFGETYGRFDKHGTEQRLWLEEAFSNTSPATYKRVPFWLSSRGYGLFANTSHALTAKVGSLDHTALSLVVDDTEALDLWFLYGPTPAEVLPRYTAVTGAPALPPRWSFGFWMSRITYRTQDEVEAVAAELRAHRIPCDVVHIDTGWFAHEYVCDFAFGPQFPDPAGMLARLAAQGFRVSLWQWPNVTVDSAVFAEGMAGGHFALRPSGHVHLQAGGYGQDAAVLDYSRPETVAWMQEKFRALFDLGVAALKVDYGEGAPPSAVYALLPSEAAHNGYPLLYQQAVWAATEAAHGPGGAVLWARAAWAGSQRYPVHWSGDGVARSEDLACVVRAALSFGLSGFPFYSSDVGGFTGLPSPELYVRWLQFGIFSSHVRAHGQPPREPWHFGPEVEDLVREHLELRYRLLPYLWTEALDCTRTSLPMVRALLLAHPDDPVACAVDDAYLFGRDLLVAPVLDEGTSRSVYLPRGEWVDLWSDEVLAGGRFVEVDAPLARIPVFVRAGAILPLGPVQQHTGERPLDPLTIRLYRPGASGAAEFVVGGGDPVRVAYRRAGDRVEVAVQGAPGGVEVEVHGAGADLEVQTLADWIQLS